MGFCTTLSNKRHHYAPSQHSERKEAVVLQLAYSQHGTGMNGVGILQPLRAAVTQSSGGTDAGTGLLWPLLGYASCWGRAVPSPHLQPCAWEELTYLGKRRLKGKQASLPEFCSYELQGNMKRILWKNLGWQKIYRPSRLYTGRCLLLLGLSWSYLIDLLSALLAGSFPQCLTSNIGVSLIFFSCFCRCLLFPCASKHRKYGSHRWLGFLLFYFKLREDVLYSQWSCLFNPFFVSPHYVQMNIFHLISACGSEYVSGRYKTISFCDSKKYESKGKKKVSLNIRLEPAISYFTLNLWHLF